MSERQYMAVVRAWLGEMDETTYHAEMFCIPRRLVPHLDSWQRYVLNRQLKWIDGAKSEVSRFFVSKVEGLVAPPDGLGGMTLQQYMMVDTMHQRHADTITETNPMGDIGRLCKMVASLYLKPDEAYFDDDGKKVADIDGNAKLLEKRANRAVLFGIWLNWRMVQNWAAKMYPLLFEPADDEQQQPQPTDKKEKKGHTRQLNMWLDTFDSFVGDDIAHLDNYRKMSALDAFRLMNRRIKVARLEQSKSKR